MELIPIRQYSYNTKENGLVDVLVPRFEDKIFGKILQPRLKNPYIKANLDLLGSQTWLLIDSYKTISEIINIMKENHEEKEEAIEDRIILFIQNLFRNGFIKFIKSNKEN